MERKSMYKRRYGLKLAIRISEILDEEPIYVGEEDVMYEVGPVTISSECKVEVDQVYFENDISKFQDLLEEIGIIGFDDPDCEGTKIAIEVPRKLDEKLEVLISNNLEDIKEMMGLDFLEIQREENKTRFYLYNNFPIFDNFSKAYFFIDELADEEFELDYFDDLLETVAEI